MWCRRSVRGRNWLGLIAVLVRGAFFFGDSVCALWELVSGGWAAGGFSVGVDMIRGATLEDSIDDTCDGFTARTNDFSTIEIRQDIHWQVRSTGRKVAYKVHSMFTRRVHPTLNVILYLKYSPYTGLLSNMNI